LAELLAELYLRHDLLRAEGTEVGSAKDGYKHIAQSISALLFVFGSWTAASMCWLIQLLDITKWSKVWVFAGYKCS
jgi:hypothetical protein